MPRYHILVRTIACTILCSMVLPLSRANANPAITVISRHWEVHAEAHDFGAHYYETREKDLPPDSTAHSELAVYITTNFDSQAQGVSFNSVYFDPQPMHVLLGFDAHAGGTKHGWPASTTGGWGLQTTVVRVNRPLYILENGNGDGGPQGMSSFTIENLTDNTTFQHLSPIGVINRYIWLNPGEYRMTLLVSRDVSTNFGRTYGRMTLWLAPEPHACCLTLAFAVLIARPHQREPHVLRARRRLTAGFAKL